MPAALLSSGPTPSHPTPPCPPASVHRRRQAHPGRWKGQSVPSTAAVQAAREAARRTQCANNLKLIGLGMFSHRTARQSFPDAAIKSKDGKPLLSWRVAILPYIDQKPLYDKFKLDEPWDSPTNKALIELIPLAYVCPGGELQKGKTTYRLISSGKSAYKDGKRVSDSALSTMGGPVAVPLVVDAGDEHAVAWTAPDVFAPSGEYGSHHLGGMNMLFADGHVEFSSDHGHDVDVPIDPNDDGTKDLAKFQGAWTVTAIDCTNRWPMTK